MDGIAIEGLTLDFAEWRLFENFSLTIANGRVTALLGRSGVGKSTLLRTIAGLARPAAGRVLRSGAVAWMAQDDLLLPWASALDNVVLGARLRGEALDYARARTLLAEVGLSAQADSLPHTLSGGERQRVALARTLMEDRAIVLMDEPFASLDALTREEVQALAMKLLDGRTVVLVTHDPLEAANLADEIVVLAGRPARVAARIETGSASVNEAVRAALAGAP